MPALSRLFCLGQSSCVSKRDTSKQWYVCIGMDLSGPLAFVSEKSGLHLDSLHAEFGRAGVHSTATQPKAIKRPRTAAKAPAAQRCATNEGCPRPWLVTSVE